jgi:hypothetical protein
MPTLRRVEGYARSIPSKSYRRFERINDVTAKMRAFRILWLLAVTVTFTSAAAAPLPRAALIIDESDPSGGTPTTFSATLRTTLSNSTPRVAVFGETIDLTRFADAKQELILRTYIKQEYSDVRFGVIVAVGASAFDLVKRWRSELWPDVPVVFAAIDETTAAGFKLDGRGPSQASRPALRRPEGPELGCAQPPSLISAFGA